MSTTPTLSNSGACTVANGQDAIITWFLQDRTFSVWSGVYSISTSCNPSTCCCLQGTFAASQFGSEVNTVLGLKGMCSGSTSAPTRWAISTSDPARTATFSFLGQQYTVTKTGTSLSIVNTNTLGCSTASALCSTGESKELEILLVTTKLLPTG